MKHRPLNPTELRVLRHALNGDLSTIIVTEKEGRLFLLGPPLPERKGAAKATEIGHLWKVVALFMTNIKKGKYLQPKQRSELFGAFEVGVLDRPLDLTMWASIAKWLASCEEPHKKKVAQQIQSALVTIGFTDE